MSVSNHVRLPLRRCRKNQGGAGAPMHIKITFFALKTALSFTDAD
jgi:hypothetical protein